MEKGENEEILTEIKTKRGWVATNFAFLENLIGRIITVSYLKIDNEGREFFMSEVVEDEYFNFGLLVNIFAKVVGREQYDFPIGKLKRLQQLRNIIIHAEVINTAQVLGTKIISLGEPMFKHGGKSYITSDVFQEYEKIEAVLKTALSKLPGGDHIKMEL
jgi:hypothetical protein